MNLSTPARAGTGAENPRIMQQLFTTEQCKALEIVRKNTLKVYYMLL